MNSFAMIFGHCVWIPPSPKAALIALHLFFGIGVHTDSEYAAGKAAIVQQYVSAGKTEVAADKEIADLDACFGTYEVPPENRNHPEIGDQRGVHGAAARRVEDAVKLTEPPVARPADDAAPVNGGDGIGQRSPQ